MYHLPIGRFHRATSHIAGRFNAKGREHKGQKHEAGKQTHFGDSDSSLEGVEETSVFVPSAGVEVLVAGEVIRFSLVVGFEEAQPGETKLVEQCEKTCFVRVSGAIGAIFVWAA